MTTRLIGERVRRSEDRRILAGHGTFIDDIEPPGCLHVAMVRSTCANGRILRIETAAAAAQPDVTAVYTAADLGELGRQALPLLIPNPNLTEPRTQIPLAAEHVHFVGEAVAMVVATSRYTAEDAAELVEVTYEPLPAVVGPLVAFGGNDLVHADMTDNVAAHFVQQHGNVSEALAAAPRTLVRRLWVERSAATPIECRGVVAIPDEFGHLLVYDTSQAPSTIRAGLSTYLNLAEHEVDVVAPDVGGGFGVKLPVFYPEEILVPWAARRLGAPVKFIEDRLEHFVASNHERAQWHEVRVGFDEEGRILALHDEFIHDAGAYCPYGIIIPIVTASRLPGPYKLPAYSSEMHVVYTNTVPVTPYRGAGMPQGAFVMERVVDLIARDLGLDRTEVRRRNFIQPDEFPYVVGLMDEDGLTTTYDSGDYPAGLDKLLEAIDYEEFAAEQAAARAEGRRIGIGFGCYVEGTGSGPYEGARVHVEPTGKVFVTTGISTQGQAHATILAQVAAEVLQVPFDDIVVRTGDTRQFKWATGTFASRIGVVASNAVAQAAQLVRDKAAQIAARILEANEADILFEDGHVSVRGSPDVRIPLRQIAVLANPLRYAFSKEALAATQFIGDGGEEEAPPRLGGRPRFGGDGLQQPEARHVRQRCPRRRRGSGQRDGSGPAASLRDRPRLRAHDQPGCRGGPGARGNGTGHRRGALRADALRQRRAVAERQLHGLPDALRHGDSGVPRGACRDPLSAQPLGCKGSGRGGLHRARGCDHRRHRGCHGCRDHRDAAQPGAAGRVAGGVGIVRGAR